MAGLGHAAVGPSAAVAGDALPPPNVVLIQTDDQVLADLAPDVMPETWAFLVEEGTAFTHYVVSTPQCCPSRAGLLTGQYPHNNGVRSNTDNYSRLIDKPSTLPSWLQEAGYYTAHIGKFLNGYRLVSRLRTPAPGWDRWFTVGDRTSYYDYDVGVDGSKVHYGDRPSAYITRVLTRQAIQVIERRAPSGQPFYLQLDERAPHDSRRSTLDLRKASAGRCVGHAIPDPRDTDRYRGVPLPRPPSFNEQDVSDKPSFIRRIHPIDRDMLRRIRRDYQCRLAALAGVDRGIGDIREALSDAGVLDRTIVIFTSDNGVYQGEHRLRTGKVVPYQEALRMPLVVRVPEDYRNGMPRVSSVDEPVSNIDLAPTLLELAGGAPCVGEECRVMDGRSLLGLIRGDAADWPADRAILHEFHGLGEHGVCEYRGLEDAGSSYVQYSGITAPNGRCKPIDERELYDLAADPFQLENLYPPQTGSEERARYLALHSLLHELRDCSGIEGRDPVPESGHYC